MDPPVNQIPTAAVDGPPAGWARLARALWPPRCLACREPGQGALDLCAACARDLPWNRCACSHCALPLPAPGVCGACLRKPPPLDAVRAAFVYAAPLDQWLRRFKFHDDLAAGRLLAALMAADPQRPPALPAATALVAVPLARRRLRARGYDQGRELARPLARALGVPLLGGALRRVRDTAAQSRLDAPARRRNLRGAFLATFDGAPPPRVLLVDDVMTTGATLHAAAAALKRAGVAQVEAWVCARVP
ncbi:ComF family protein [Lysobacter silvisoli]|uniref:ComF family protein n=1 Tax=Lysobacter silvisoli TaxID=2293254 RepID=A0A371JXU7_9GAMM|nr:ComF family protein [Lysobacter silvisoli]RDZ26485.1 ComF family protein [Lysobacter silvisoli]